MILHINKLITQSTAVRLSLALLAVAFTTVVACSSSGDTSGSPASSLNVVTTIYPVTYFAERIGGERVAVGSLAKPGVEAHDFEPSPGDIIALREADVFVYTDPAFEVWVEDALANVGSNGPIAVRTANLEADHDDEQDAAESDDHDHGGVDPHVWLNPREAIEQVRAIQAAFIEADSVGVETYATNADILVTELQTLDVEIASALTSCTLDTIVVSHLAYGHFAERYAITQIGLADLSAEFETTPRRIADIIEQIKLLGVGHILQEPILNDDLANTVAGETGAEILPLHPLESLTSAELEAGDTYFTVMRRNLDSLKIALNCS